MHTENCTMILGKENVVFEFQYKVCHMSAHHVCLINMLFGYIFKLLCSIKVCAPMWHILSSLNPIFLHFFGQNAIFAQKNPPKPPPWADDFEVPKFYVLVSLWPSSARTRYIRYWRMVYKLLSHNKWLDDKRHRILCLVMIFFEKLLFLMTVPHDIQYFYIIMMTKFTFSMP